MQLMGAQQATDGSDQRDLMAKGTQNIDRNDMMSNANLAQAAQSF